MKADLQADENIFPHLELNRVGIKGVKKRIEVHRESGEILYTNPIIDAYVQLPENQRAIHMSRSVESIESAINKSVVEPGKSIEQFAKKILDSLLDHHDYSQYAEVNLTGDLIIQYSSNNGYGNTNSNGNGNDNSNGKEVNLVQKTYGITCNAKVFRTKESKKEYDLEIGISAFGMTCCPCAQQMNKEFSMDALKNSKDLNLTEEQIEKILSIVPIASHNQRALAMIILKTKDIDNELIDLFDLAGAIENGMSGKIKSILKRPEEASLVRTAHTNPFFVEDAVRLIAYNLSSKSFVGISDSTGVTIKIESYESIHSHNAYAELTCSFKDIRETAVKFDQRS